MQKALGLIETIGLVSAIEAADAAVKAANVYLVGYSNTKGGGKITVKVVGDVGAVQAAVAAGVAAAARIGKVYGSSVIPRPHDEIAAMIQSVDRGGKPEAPAPAAPPAPQAVAPAMDKPADETPAVPLETPPAAQCVAITKSGQRCKLPARPGSQYCNFHRKLDQAAG